MPLRREQEIHDLHLKFLGLVDEQLTGLYRSAYKGHGYELAEIRKYVPGDEIRLIDWNVTARTGNLHIRQNLEDKELTIYILADASASGMVHSFSKSKQQFISELSVILTLTCVRNRDKVSIVKFTDEIEGYLPPSKSSIQSIKTVELMFSQDSKSKKTSIKSALKQITEMNKTNALVFLVSDFLDDGFLEDLELVAEMHDLICIQITDPLDMAIPDVGLIEFTDVEKDTTHIINTSNKKLLKQINQKLQKRQNDLLKLFSRVNCEHIQLDVNADMITSLKQYFKQRKRGRYHVGA